MKSKYSGDIRIIEGSLDVKYGKDKVIFIDHLNDLFAADVPDHMILSVLNHCLDYPDNKYVFQTKNPQRYLEFRTSLPDDVILGTTIESNRRHDCMGETPSPMLRAVGIRDAFATLGHETFITIEPILDFDVKDFAELIIYALPSFVNIGADSKGHGLIEPSYDKIMELYNLLIDAGIEVRKKLNLDRLAKEFQ